jgi:hypothetical protein
VTAAARERFIHRLFQKIPDAPWAERWPPQRFKRWDERAPEKQEPGAEPTRRARVRKEESFLHRLLDSGCPAPWLERWPAPFFKRWNGASDDEGATEEEGGRLDANEMVALAPSCNRQVLMQILKFGNDSAMLAALENHALEIDDVAGIAESPKSGTAVLGAIGRRREWSGDPRIAKSLCLNPKAPYFVTRALLNYLQPADIREIMTNPLVPPGLTKDCRMTLERKTQRHKR